MAAISTRETVIKSLLTTLGNITVVNGFASTVLKVLRGIQPEQAFAGNMPGLALWNEKGPTEIGTQGKSKRRLVLHVWGYVNVEADEGDYDNLDKLLADVETALLDSTWNSYWGSTEVKNFTVYEGGVDMPIGMFDMEFEVYYFYNFATP